MSILDKKGISVTSGFKLVSGQPLDARNVVDDLDGLQDLINNGAAYEGIVVYVKSEQQLKQYNGSEWNNVYPESDIITVNSLPNIANAKLDKIYRVPKLLISSGTALPNTGTVGNIHFNTTLSISEVEDILNELTFTGEAYLALAASDESPIIVVYKHTDPEGMVIRSESGSGALWANEGAVQNYASTYGITHAGWQDFDNPKVLNEEVKATAGGASVGTQNGLLTGLIFTDPYSETIVGYTYHRANGNYWLDVLNGGSSSGSSEGSSDFIDVEELPSATIESQGAVPNSGYVEKVYFNTSLSDSEVEALLSQLTYNIENVGYAFYGNLSTQHMILVYNLGDGKAIVNTVGTTVTPYWANQAFIDSGMASNMGITNLTTAGWQSFDNPIEINAEADTEFNEMILGEQNSLITNLVYAVTSSLNPDIDLSKIYRVANYSSGGGAVVPNSGTVGKVYFNTSMSDEEVETILSKLTYNSNIGNVNLWLFTADESNMIAAMGSEGAYGILNDGTQKVYWANQTAVDLMGANYGVTTAGWQTFDNPIEINTEVISDLMGDGLVIAGAENDLIKELFYTEPLVEPEFIGYSYYRVIDGEWVEVLGEPGGPEGTKKIITLPPIIDVNTYDYTFSDEDINLLKEDKAILQIQTLVNGEVAEGFYNVLNLSSVMGSGGFYVGVSYELLNYYLNLIFVNYETKEMPIVNRTPLYSKLSISLYDYHILHLNDLYSEIDSVDLLPLVDYWYSNNTNSIKTATENSLKSKKRTITPSPLPPWNAIYDPDPQLADSPFMISLTTDELNNITAISSVFTVLLEDGTDIGEFVANSLALFDDNGKPYFKFMLCSNVGEGKEWSFEFNFIDDPTTTQQGYLTTQNISDVYNSKTKELIGTIGKITFKKINVFFNY